MKPAVALAALAVGGLALAACSTPGRMLAPAPAALAPRAPAAVASDTALVIYSHGSRAEFARDRCAPRRTTMPPAIAALAGERLGGYRVAVYADCTPSTVGDYHHVTRTGTPKVDRRAGDLRALLARLEDLGLPPARIILAGHSAGAWASLRAVEDGRPPVAGVIALAPAFAGPIRGRSHGWQWLRDTQARALAAGPGRPTLAFAFHGDAFEPPDHLAFLHDHATMELVAVGPAGEDPARCTGVPAHRAAFAPCFAQVHGARIRAFAASRLADAPRRQADLAATGGTGEQSRP